MHDETEVKLLSKKIFDQSYTLDDYKNLLIHNYRLISLYEPKIQNELEDYPDLKLDLRTKIDALKKDLGALGISTETEKPTQVHLQNKAEAFGALYVIEGSTLGGNVISKQLKKNQAFENVDFHYFGIYKENTGSMWQEFKTILDNTILENDYNACLAGAKKAYQILP